MRNKEKKEQSESILIACLALFILTVLLTFTSATPTGPNSINITSNETGVPTLGMQVNVSGGYIAKLNITATSQNDRWKAFVGEIDGRFTLDDASGSTIYDWTSTTVNGEVYATRESTAITWSTVQCADAAHIIQEDADMVHAGEDNITSTFTDNSNANPIKVGDLSAFAAGTCAAINTYVSDLPQATDFEEVILYDTTSTSIIFATILETNTEGYDGSDYDFQMIVPENASSSFTGLTPYYLYLELGS
jgi:hypothetical protein